MSALCWQPSAPITTLRHRAKVLEQIRHFFRAKDYLEVDTPIMAKHGVSDPYLTNIKAVFRQQTYALQTSPEYHMKRLLAAGSGPIFQLARVFRDDELGRWHNPEFTLLEWYQLAINHHALMDEVEQFLQAILHIETMKRISYLDAFLGACQLDPFTAPIKELRRVLADYQLEKVLAADETDRDQYLFLLMSHVVEPFLAQEENPVAVYHFPSSQSALAKVSGGVAERFEVYYQGVELANGFHELTDAKAQAQRFFDDNRLRAQLGVPCVEPDSWLLQALEQGLPACSGVALGVDRLVALALQKNALSDVLSFDISRA